MRKKDKEPKPTQTKGQPQAPQFDKRPPVPKTVNMRTVQLLRVVLWVLLGFVFVRGLFAIIFPTNTELLITELGSKVTQVAQNIKPTSEMTAFAESFAREYFTYKPHQNDDYKKRLSRYCDGRLAGEICEGVNLRGGATAIYASALEIVPYNNSQHDITVLVMVEYIVSMPVITDGKEMLKDEPQTFSTYLTVPVYASLTGGYIVEDMPLVTSPPMQATDYKQVDYSGTPADERVKMSVQTMLGDFFKTLYSEEQRRIDYYLTEDADRKRLREIKSSMTFVKLEGLSVFVGATANSYTCIATMRLEDKSGTNVKQRLNLELVENGSRFYVKSINLRSHNLKE